MSEATLESQIAEWRAFVAHRPAVDGHDVDELETHLRDQIADLDAAGLTDDEAFLIAVRRLGSLDELSREYAREHSGRLWRQLWADDQDDATGSSRSPGVEALFFAVGAAVSAVVVRAVAGLSGEEPWWVLRNAGLFVLPFLAGWLVRRRGLDGRTAAAVAAPFVLVALLVNLYPMSAGGTTELLVAAHLPVVLWFLVVPAYTGGALRSHERRMDFVRFTGEWVIYYVLIALGGGVLMGLTVGILDPAGIDAEHVISWVLPAGAAGAVVVAGWLVEAKQRVVENMAPVLTMLFTPLFALMLAVAAVAYVATGVGAGFDRELLGLFDALMVVVLGLVLYGMSARDPSAPAGWMDHVQLVAVVAALVLDVIVLGAMASRIGELGFTPNRTAALGLNLVLLVNLAGTAALSLRFLTGRGTFHRVERWQTAYLPVLAGWAAFVVVVLPPLFRFA